jgi:predicted ferric reductase
VNLGSVAWWGLILLVVLTLVIKLPYDKWKISHKFMGAVFIFAVLHTFLMQGLISDVPYLFAYFTLLSLLAITAILYKTILFSFIIKHYYYQVEKVDRLTNKIMEITLEPQNKKLTFIPGQYCFFSFINSHFTREAHPFTLCSTPKSEKIQIVVKSLGDFTLNLYQTLEPLMLVSLEGPYGRFNYRLGHKNQVWISGGVGIAPFISWLKSMQDGNLQDQWNIDFYYCVNTRDEVIHYDEFKKLENQLHKFHTHVIAADEKGFLKAADIPHVYAKEIYICGPKEMRRSLLKQFRDLHIPKKQIHYEDFDFL